ncbi:MAG: RadC family protein [Pseudomonadota bacterium]
MAILDWQPDERPRERLLANGPGALSDAELLAICLRTGVRGESAVDLARNLLTEHGGVRGLLTGNRHALLARKGLGAAKYAQLLAVAELGRRYAQEVLRRGEALTSPQAARDYLTAQLRDHPQEVFGCLFLDNRHRVLAFEELFRGTVNAANVYPREVVRAALRHNAAALILAHNHPSGVAEPSDADVSLTRRLKTALELVDVRVLDHIVIGDGHTTSLAERGQL